MLFTHIGWLGFRDHQSFDRYWHGDGYTIKTHACNVHRKLSDRYRSLCGKTIIPGDGSIDSHLSTVVDATEASWPSCKRCRTLLKRKAERLAAKERKAETIVALD